MVDLNAFIVKSINFGFFDKMKKLGVFGEPDETFSTISQFLSYCNDVVEYGTHLNVFTLLTNRGVTINKIEDIAKRRGLFFEPKKHADNLYFCKLGVRKSCVSGFFLINEDFWLFITSDNNANTIKSFSRYFSPDLNLEYIDSDKLNRLIRELKEQYNRIILFEGTLIKEGETLRTWKKKPIEFSVTVSKRIESDEKARWSAISLLLSITGKSRGMRLRIYSYSQLTLYQGSFTDFYSNVISVYVLTLKHDAEFFRDRERKIVDKEIVLESITLMHEKNFEYSQIKTLVSRLTKGYMTSIISEGNPFLLMQITDRYDGSSYDFYIYKNKIEIVPLLKATSRSLNHLYASVLNVLPIAKLQQNL